ncbi:hypothetical protein [Aquabacterium sp.]|uniref:hypothetical protein n=1 Tax=Aquabacterium sp. TaxID=1872578 RepID=UPI002C5AB535|nr:hypothetical protein [Aquabacterium sp.]HSW05800.1 hypothetical protein [Aquabacterium sp.]
MTPWLLKEAAPVARRRKIRGVCPGLFALMLAAGCSSPPPPSAPPVVVATPAPAPAAPAARAPAPPPALPSQRRAVDWDDYRMQAAHRIVAASKAGSYDGPVPEPLLAIPVLEIELNADGSVRRVTVLRKPRQALDTVQLAIDAVHRAAPFGDVRHLPRPWRFSEVFLFNDDRRFKPRSLDL